MHRSASLPVTEAYGTTPRDPALEVDSREPIFNSDFPFKGESTLGSIGSLKRTL